MDKNSYINTLSAYRESFLLMALGEIVREAERTRVPLDPSNLGQSLTADPGLLTAIFDSCVATGFLQKEGHIYSLSSEAGLFLAESSITHHSSRYHMSYIPLWGDLPNLAVGKSALTERPSEQVEKDPEAFKDFVRGVVDAHSKTLDVFVELAALDGISTLLDVGSGAGSYSLALLERYSEMTVTLLDFGDVLNVAEEYAAAKSLAERVRILPGDLRFTEFGGPYDCVLFSNVLHLQSRDDARAALVRAVSALKPDGLLLINEPTLDRCRTSPKTLAIFNITVMLRSGLVGSLFSLSELRELACSSGFKLVREHSISGDYDLYDRPYTLLAFKYAP
jgi:cyclopropane fatty-acyl-phospholipid synthase-like methyltransferase